MEGEPLLQKKIIEDEIKQARKDFRTVTFIYLALLILYILVFVTLWASMCSVNHVNRLENQEKRIHPTLNQVMFPELEFLPVPSTSEDYYSRVQKGYTQMKKRKLVIAGLARDVADTLANQMIRLEKIGKTFLDYRIIIFENNSVDETRSMIKKWINKNKHVELLECWEDQDCHLPSNASKAFLLAQYRNRLLNHIKHFYGDWDNLLVVDFNQHGPISIDGLASSFSYKNWDMMAAYALQSDFRFFSSHDFVHHECAGDVWQGEKKPERKRGETPYPVQSAFEGAALYDLNSIIQSGAFYEQSLNEHISFHENMNKLGYGKFYQNPSFLVLHSIKDAYPFDPINQ